ncbi:cytochrome C [Skermanella stibiiresistens SB22]|uniref:Cytochrome C n=1 Tax=Skermanella stibiiresistens SB22 TaxID=1385369 RepID=W9H851_9PROT|nr:cytochrome c [Skermanella stibiiresistens]EWY42184.1 cytochrome C [Skermanella stibiiresistens SB22]
MGGRWVGMIFGSLLALTVPGHAEDVAQRGEYLAAIMDCGGCHTDGALAGQPNPSRRLAGSSIGFEIPGLGVFYPPNLTSDRQTGMGDWSAADIAKALRTGVRPDGRELAPAMPWRAYANLNDDDLAALAAYLKGLEPVVNKVPPIVASGDVASAPYLTVAMPKK